MTTASYAALIAAVLLRPVTGIWPNHATELLSSAGLCWIIAFALCVVENGRVLVRLRLERGS